MTIYTIGHSTKTTDEFISLLKDHGIRTLIDIRTIPRSRHNPQFNTEALSVALQEKGIEYIHMKGLGGLRHARKDSRNAGWRSKTFRGFADYMDTDEFSENLAELIRVARRKTTVIMCAEAVPWRCHRSLIADALTSRDVRVIHILGPTSTLEHKLTSWAKVEKDLVTYPGENPGLF